MDIDNEIEKLKSEAAHILDKMFNIPEGFSSGSNRRIVDCIVSAAILEVASLNAKAVRNIDS